MFLGMKNNDWDTDCMTVVIVLHLIMKPTKLFPSEMCTTLVDVHSIHDRSDSIPFDYEPTGISFGS